MSRKSYRCLTTDETWGGKVTDWSSFGPANDWTWGTIILRVENDVGFVDGESMILWTGGALIDNCRV